MVDTCTYCEECTRNCSCCNSVSTHVNSNHRHTWVLTEAEELAEVG
jgi:hypothetical protein